MQNLINNCTDAVAKVIEFHISEFVENKGRADLPNWDGLFDDQRVRDAINDTINDAVYWQDDIVSLWSTLDDRDNIEPHFEYTNSTTARDLMLSAIRQTVEDSFFDILADADIRVVEDYNYDNDTEFDNYEELHDWLVHNIG